MAAATQRPESVSKSPESIKVEGPTPVLLKTRTGICLTHVTGGVPVVFEATGKSDLVLLMEELLPTLVVEIAVRLRQIAGGRHAKGSASPHVHQRWRDEP